jgi:hypothetical protein
MLNWRAKSAALPVHFRAWVRHIYEVGILHFLAETYFNARCKTRFGRAAWEAVKGESLP